jgi:hypothetical protein
LTSPGAEALDSFVSLGHLKDLQAATSKIKTWIDKEVAHYDPNTGRFSEQLTFGDVRRAIDLISRP